MTTPAKRRKVTVIASQSGVELAERSLPRLGFSSKSEFAKANLIGKSTVDNFFTRKGIQLDSFKRICEGLKLNWSEILEQDSSVNPITVDIPALSGTSKTSCSVPSSSSGLIKDSIYSTNTVDRKNKETKLVLVLEGDFNSFENETKQAIEILLRNGFGSTIRIVDIQSGSIRITIQGKQEDLVKLVDCFTSGELSEINGFVVEELQALDPEMLEEIEPTSSVNKWELVRDIVNNPKRDRQLVGVDLSDADLSGADLRSADLSDADLSGADLSEADLRSADFNRADLSGADLSYADLRSITHSTYTFAYALVLARALVLVLNFFLDLVLVRVFAFVFNFFLNLDLNLDLNLNLILVGANLSNANLSNAKVYKAQLGSGLGLSEAEKRDLAQRGAIFDEAPGDRSLISSPSPIRR